MWRIPLALVVLTRTSSASLIQARSSGRLVTAFYSVNGGDDERPRQTGWNHNTPDQDSDFWKDGPETKKQRTNSKVNLRTGWLHNTESPEKKATSGTSPSPNTARRRLELAMKEKARNHRMVVVPTFHAGNGAQHVVTEHYLSVPLIQSESTTSSGGDRIDVYFSILEKVTKEEDQEFFAQLQQETDPQQRARAYVEHAAMQDAQDMMIYLQGGPGFGAPTPVSCLGLQGSWASQALASYKRVVLMDQRGTGRSTPITKQTLELQFPALTPKQTTVETREAFPSSYQQQAAKDGDDARGLVVKQAADYLSHFRADSICHDAEEIRDALLLPFDLGEEEKPRPWGASLGQSFGGFCSMTYLSLIEHPPTKMLLTGGIAPMLTSIDDVYASLAERVKERCLRYYDMYPGDVALVKRIVRLLLKKPIPLPSGGWLTARRFLQLGLGLGGSPSAFASMHALLSSALLTDRDEFSRTFLKQIEVDQSFDDAPLYFWLHESIYADGATNAPTNWSAHRTIECKMANDPSFAYMRTSQEDCPDPVLFTGEMVFPWMSEDYGELAGLHDVAEALARKTDWTPLYNAAKMREALESKTRAAAAVYVEDMYVDYDACKAVTARGAPLEKAKLYITNEYQHSGLRDDGASIFEKLHGMIVGGVRTPS